MKKRLDTLVYEKGLAPTRARAKALVMEGAVTVGGVMEDKPGLNVDESVIIEVTKNPLPFVSRGGLKIQKALDEFSIDVKDRICMDVGASTGGFTDCMLQRGAKLVYSVDVGYGQLDYSLRMDERVVVMERTNIRNIEAGSLTPPPEFTTMDVSFISITKIIPAIESVITGSGEMVVLIKPQFEAGKEQVGKGGVVRDISVHRQVIEGIGDYFTGRGYTLLDLSYSPIKGPKGNIEYLLHVERETLREGIDLPAKIKEVTGFAHEELK